MDKIKNILELIKQILILIISSIGYAIIKIYKFFKVRKYLFLAWLICSLAFIFWAWTYPKEAKIEDLEKQITINDFSKNLYQVDRERKKTEFIVIHHTASEKNINQTDEEYIKEIEKIHLNKNFNSIAYHLLVIKDKIYRLHPLNMKIAGVEGFNSSTINICMVGNFEERKPNEIELKTLKDLIFWVKTKAYKKPKICFHGDLNNTACCGKYLKEELKEWIKELK